MKQYTDHHEWVEIEGAVATVGVSALAVKEIGEIVFVELPKIGTLLQKEELAVVVESSKAAIEIVNPIAGVVTSVNSQLVSSPHLVNQDPESTGWLYQLHLTTL